MQLSSLTKRERRLAERVAGGPLADLSDDVVLAVGFVVARRKEPTLPLITYLRKHKADEVLDELELVAPDPPKQAEEKPAAAKKTAAK